MQKTKRLRLAGVATMAALSLTLAACGGDAGNSNGAGASNVSPAPEGLDIEVNPEGDYNPLERDQIQDGGELTLALAELTQQQNAFHANMTSDTRAVWNWYNPVLANFDGAGNYSPNEAYVLSAEESVEDDKTVVTYKLNPEAKFNDGTPIDIEAFKNTWEMNNGSNAAVTPNSTDGYELIETVEAGADNFEVIVKFSTAYPWWQGLFNNVLHPEINTPEKFDNEYLNNLKPEYGAGPFKVESVDFNAGTVVFTRNDNWWGDEAKLDKVTYRQMESQATINAFEAGEIDAAGVGNRENLEVAASMGDAIDVRAALRPSNALFTLNSDAPALADIKVREAIFNGIDRAQLAQIRYNGMGYSEELPGSLILFSTQEGYEDNLADLVSYDPEKSKSILEEAGYTLNDAEYYEKDGEQLSIRYVVVGDDEVSKSIALATQKMLKDIGIEMTIDNKPSSEFSDITSERDFDMFFSGFASSDPFGVAYFGQIYNSDSDLNMSGTGTPELDEKIKELQQLPTAEEQIERSNELEKEAFAQYGLLPWANGPSYVAVKKGLANMGAAGFAVLPKENIGWAKE